MSKHPSPSRCAQTGVGYLAILALHAPSGQGRRRIELKSRGGLDPLRSGLTIVEFGWAARALSDKLRSVPTSQLQPAPVAALRKRD